MTAKWLAALGPYVRRHKSSVWLVGGPVRDDLLHLPCQDWDFVCRNARQLARAISIGLKAKFIVLDEQYRIYRVILPDRVTCDVAELQGKTLEQDLGRRDFTINAMARLYPAGNLIDPFHGERDLLHRSLRSVSERALQEDPLRTLRAFRFAAQFQLTIESRTTRWIKKHRAGLKDVSAERIREELLRLWKQPQTLGALHLMDHTGLLREILPEIESCRRTAVRYYGKGGVLKHSFETVENLEWIFAVIASEQGERGDLSLVENLRLPRRSPKRPPRNDFLAIGPNMRGQIAAYLQSTIGGYTRIAWLKWAAFLHDIGKPATAKIIKGRLRFFEHEHVGASLAMKLGQRLRLSRQEIQLLGMWVRNHMRTGNLAAAPRITERAISRYFRDLGEEGVGMILISLADHYTYLRKSRWGNGKDPVEKVSQRLLISYFEERSKILPARLIDGHLLMKKLKLKPGPVVGRLLGQIQDAQADGKVKTAEEAIAYARKKVRY